MATIINNPPANNSNGPIGLIVTLVTLLVLGYLGYVYGLPAIKQMQFGNPQINVPSKIDINVNQAK